MDVEPVLMNMALARHLEEVLIVVALKGALAAFCPIRDQT
jgi:hypothetical protein